MKTEILRVEAVETGRAAIAAAVERLRRGEVVALPTETVYGLAALPSAAKALRAAKGRDEGKPFTWAVASRAAAEELVDLTALGPAKLARRYWPGPLTLVAQRHDGHGDGTLGVRVPGHPVAAAILQQLATPLLLTSANRSGDGDATTADEALTALDGRIGLVLDGGPSQLGEPSTVVSFAGTRPLVHRAGMIDRGMVLRTAARMVLLVCSGNTCRSPMARALLEKLWADRLAVKPSELLEHGGLVLSAGVNAPAGSRASPEAVELLAARGIELESHRSRPLTLELLRFADHVWAMTASHRRAILAGIAASSNPADLAGAEKKVELLDHDGHDGSDGPDGKDIPDPIGGGLDDYRRTLQTIERALERRVARFA